MSNIIHTESVTHGKRRFAIHLMHDHDCSSPLEDDEGVFITCRKGARSQFGNTPLDSEDHQRVARRIHAFNDPAVQLAESLRDDGDEEVLRGEPLIGLPVFAYEHGSVALSTSSWLGRAHHASWDSAQSGYIYVTRETALGWHGGKRLTKAKIERTYKNLTAIVEVYGRWLNGECYGYLVTEDGEDKEVDACWGFIGYDYALAEARDYVKALVRPRRAA